MALEWWQAEKQQKKNKQFFWCVIQSLFSYPTTFVSEDLQVCTWSTVVTCTLYSVAAKPPKPAPLKSSNKAAIRKEREEKTMKPERKRRSKENEDTQVRRGDRCTGLAEWCHSDVTMMSYDVRWCCDVIGCHVDVSIKHPLKYCKSDFVLLP